MKILLYGMQSSGASLIAYFLGQQPRSVSLVDIWVRHLTPALPSNGANPVIAKCVVSTQFDLEDHVRRFRPDRTILTLRHPVQNYVSLLNKGYVDDGGSIDEKFQRMDRAFEERERFDLTLAYEDFVRRPEQTVERLQGIGVPAEMGFYEFRRSVEEIRTCNFNFHPWCKQRYGFGWGFGNVQGKQLDPAKLYRPAPLEAEEKVRQLAPSVCAYYDEHFAWLGDTTVAATASAAPSAPARLQGYLGRVRARLR